MWIILLSFGYDNDVYFVYQTAYKCWVNVNERNTLKLARSKVISKAGLGRWLTPARLPQCVRALPCYMYEEAWLVDRRYTLVASLPSLLFCSFVRPLQLDLFFWLPRDPEGNIVVSRETVLSVMD